MRVILTLSILVAVFAFSRAEYPELSEGSMAEVERVRKFTDEDAERETKFWLYTTKNRETGQPLGINDLTLLKASNFDASKPVRFLTHGFLSTKDNDFQTTVTKAYLDRGDFNVICVDWSVLSLSFSEYDIISGSIHHISYRVAEMARFLNKQGVRFKEMYLIGHSLGAHISGMAGQNLTRKVGVIFGLDPAGPNFEDIPIDHRLDAGDARYVETIQTDIVPNLAFTVSGIRRTAANKYTTYGYIGVGVGRASFFPNYGRTQPGCNRFGAIPSCSHSRAYVYFAESLNNTFTFYGQKCKSFLEVKEEKCTGKEKAAIMGGEPAHTKNRGIFYVPIADYPPYSAYVEKVGFFSALRSALPFGR